MDELFQRTGKVKLLQVVVLMTILSFSEKGEACVQKETPLIQHQRTNYTFGGLFIDEQHPIPCNGTIVKWHYCYYPAVGGSSFTTYSLTLGVFYADKVIVLTRHILRPESFITVDIRGADMASDYTCLSMDHTFEVTEGEYVGMFIESDQEGFRTDDVLDVVGLTQQSSDYLQWESTFCQGIYQPDSVPILCFSPITGYTMQAYVEYESIPGPAVDPTTSTQGTQAPPVMPTQTSTTQAQRVPSSTTQAIQRVPSSTTRAQPIQETTASSNPVQSDNLPIAVYTQPSASSTAAASLYKTVSVTLTTTSTQGNGGGDEQRGNFSKSSLTIALAVAGIAVAMLILIGIIVGAAAVRYRRRKRVVRLKQRKEHRHIGLNHFVMVSDEQKPPTTPPVAYESPRPTIKHRDPGRHIHADNNNIGMVKLNPTYYDLETDQSNSGATRYQMLADAHTGFQGGAEGTTVTSNGYELNPTTEYHTTRHLNRQNPSINTAKSTIEEKYCYSMLCNHYYKTLDMVATHSNDGAHQEEMFEEPANNEVDLYAQVNKQRLKELLPKDIKIEAHLGSGQFGRVSQGVWNSPRGPVNVAVKSLLSSRLKQTQVYRVKLLQEAAIMGQFLHPNVIQLMGVVNKRDTLMVVLELADKGDLEKLLVSMVPDPGQLVTPDTYKTVLSFCQQVAFGVHYLASKGFVHRDLAARNILVTKDNVLKIADFGMSRELANQEYYVSQGGKIPVKWTAPEAINFKKYSTASDVWSYGCLLYEIWSLGQTPFRDCSNTEALEKLESGYRLPPPPGCPKLIYEMMIDCWHPKWQLRPLFNEIILDLLVPEKVVLFVPPEATATHKLAGVLGGPLEAGEGMYTDLQWKYYEENEEEEP